MYLYVIDNSGTLTKDEIIEMIEFVYGTSNLNNHVKNILKDFDSSGDGIISRKEFVGKVNNFPALFFPAYEMQEKLRKACLGTDFWLRKARNADAILARPEVQNLYKADHKVDAKVKKVKAQPRSHKKGSQKQIIPTVSE